MPCSEVEKLLGPYHDGELNAEQRVRVEEHVRHCPRCAARLEEMDSYAAMILRLCGHHIPPPPEMKPSLFRRLRRQVLRTLAWSLILMLVVIIPLSFAPILFREDIPRLGRALLGLSGLTLTIAPAPFFYQALRDAGNVIWYRFTTDREEEQ